MQDAERISWRISWPAGSNRCAARSTIWTLAPRVRLIPKKAWKTPAILMWDNPKALFSRTTAAWASGPIVLGYGNFNKYARFDLGVTVSYSAQAGATIDSIKPGGAAEKAGL